jgi:hypothetical protein
VVTVVVGLAAAAAVVAVVAVVDPEVEVEVVADDAELVDVVEAVEEPLESADWLAAVETVAWVVV